MDNEEEKGRLLTAAQVAEIWNERAKKMGFPDTHYTRFSVRQRTSKSKAGEELVPAHKTPIGYLYWEKDAWEVKLQPQKSRARRQNEEEDTQPRMKAIDKSPEAA